MDNISPKKKVNYEQIFLYILFVICVVFLFLILFSVFGGNHSKVYHTTASDLINTEEIATLSVSEFVYNGIARTYKENGEPDYNVIYHSTVKVSINADQIKYAVDEEHKIVKFIFPEIEIGKPIIDIYSLSTIPDKKDLYIDEIIRLCREDALDETKKSNKLIESAQENLKTIMEVWYSPVFSGYTFEYQFVTPESGEA